MSADPLWSALAEQLQALQSPGAMASWLWPSTKQTDALRLIDQHLVRLAATPGSRLILTMPPQEGKSQRVSRDFVLWLLKTNPRLRIIAASYGQALANRNARAVRAAIQRFSVLNMALAPGQRRVDDWRLDNGVGGLRAVGIGAGLTGHAADVIVVDDPIKSAKEADSEAYRENTWQWWLTEAQTRFSSAETARAAVILTRWHEDDLAGRLIREQPGRWTVLNIPAQADEDDPLGRQPGEFLTSAQGRTPAEWEQIKADVGPRVWESLYQGNPSPPGGALFLRDTWKHWDARPPVDASSRFCHSWDLTFKDGKRSDFVVGQVWLRTGANVYLIDQVRGRWGFSETQTRMQALHRKWPMAGPVLVEDRANGPAIIDSLKSTVPGLTPVQPIGSKYARASAYSPFQKAGNVYLPPRSAKDGDGKTWVDGFIEEHAGFPTAAHDDQVDASGQAVYYLMVPQGSFGTGLWNLG